MGLSLFEVLLEDLKERFEPCEVVSVDSCDFFRLFFDSHVLNVRVSGLVVKFTFGVISEHDHVSLVVSEWFVVDLADPGSLEMVYGFMERMVGK